MKHAVIIGAILTLVPVATAAQARFQTGALAWTPQISLHDAGFDTNVFDTPDNPKRDTTAVLTPQFDGVLELASFTMATSAVVDFVYFDRYTEERSINKRATVRIDVPLSRFRPFVGGGYIDARERQGSEIDLRARRTEKEGTAGARISVTPRGSVELSVRLADARYDEGQLFRGVDLAEQLNRRSESGAIRFRYSLSPLTMFVVDTDLARDNFLNSPDRDTQNLRVTSGFEFAPDAVIRGRASVGYHKMDAKGAAARGFEGLMTSVDLGYVLLNRTRFNGRISRDTSYSVEEQIPYYVQTGYGAEVTHTLFGPIDAIVRGSREKLDYAASLGVEGFVEYVNRYGGGIAVRATDTLRLNVNYEFGDRRSTGSMAREFERRRLYTTVTYGF
jgi:hypothetical protein